METPVKTRRRNRINRTVQVIELMHKGRPFRQILQARLDLGHSMREIASEWGVHYTYLYNLAKQHGVTLPGHGEGR